VSAALVVAAAQARVVAAVMQRSGVREPTLRAAPEGTVRVASLRMGAAAACLLWLAVLVVRPVLV
jgi:hypothetical protein